MAVYLAGTDVMVNMADVDDIIPVSKKRKIDNDVAQNNSSKRLTSFTGFKISKILNENLQSRSIFILGRFEEQSNDAVIILEKSAFEKKYLDQILSEATSLSQVLQNDIYGSYEGYVKTELNGIKVTVICPATEKHIEKYIQQPIHIIHETPQIYETVTLPFLKSSSFSIQWVYNILQHEAEQERIVFEDPDAEIGFIMLPDLKWLQGDKESLYLIAICHRKDLKSLRDLNNENLPLLRNLQDKGCEIIKEKYGVSSSQLRIFVHYQPSYYHFHVHFTHLKFIPPGINVERAHLLNDVINNIEINNKYYQLKTLSFCVKENEPLYDKFKEAGVL